MKYKIESKGRGTTVRKEYRNTLKGAETLACRRAVYDKHRGVYEACVFEKVSVGGNDTVWELIGRIEGTPEGQIVRVIPAECRPSVEYAREQIERFEELVNLAHLRAAGFGLSLTAKTHETIA